MPSSTTLAVQCRHVVKKFHTGENEIMALSGVDLDVAPSEFLMLVGPSGCGKTTLISIIAGILKSDEGSCSVLGEDFSRMRSTELLEFRAKHIGFIFQQFNLLPSLTIAENVAVPLIINHVPRRQAVEAARAMLDEVGLADRSNHKPSQLSGGQQQRVAIARALVHSPQLLLCDEPTSALDHDTGMRILELMRSMNKKRGTTLVVVTHDNRIFQYAQRIAHMDDGRIDRFSTPSSSGATI